MGLPSAARRLAFGIAMIAACSGTEPADPCDELVNVSVETQEKTSFAWVPACKINRLVVTTADFGQEMWAIQSNFPNDLIGPVIHGELPAGIQQEGQPQPLEAGTSYVVVLSVVDAEGAATTVGTRTFTKF